MSAYRFAVEHTGRPFTGKIPESAWTEVSRHITFRAAGRACAKRNREMRESCGVGGWDNHYRIVALRDTSLSGTYYCRCGEMVVVCASWPAGQPQPNMPLPTGWRDSVTCEQCAKLES